MAFIEVVGAIKLEPSVLKLEPVVEICPADIYHSYEEEEDKDLKVHINEPEISEAKTEDQDEHGDNEFRATDNVREGEHLVLNFNKKVPSDKSKKNIKGNLAHIDRTRQSANMLEDLKKVKIVYGSSWSKPIQREEYTYKSKTSMTCNYCHREFHVMRNLGKHIRTIHRESSVTYYCPYCPKQSRWSLRCHILQKHKNESEIFWFQCYHCDKKFRMKRELKKHIQGHIKRKVKESLATYPPCGPIFCGEPSMKVRKKRYHCEICNYNISDVSAFKYHIEVCHTDPSELPTHQCRKCDFKTRYKKLFILHCKKHETQFCCETCGHTTRTLGSMKLHQNTHKTKIDDKTLRYQCKKCDYKTYRHYSFRLHELNHLKPEEINYFYCYLCDFKSKRKDNLKTHINRHFKKEEVSLQCFICDFKTKKRSTLTTHINRHQKSSQNNEK